MVRFQPASYGVPDWENGQAYELWLQKLRSDGISLTDTVAFLESQPGPLPKLRAAVLALDWPEPDKARELASKARGLSCEPEYLALTDYVLCQLAMDSDSVVPRLLTVLEELAGRHKSSYVALEAEIQLYIALSVAYRRQFDFARAQAYASKAVLLSESLRLPITHRVALDCFDNSRVDLTC